MYTRVGSYALLPTAPMSDYDFIRIEAVQASPLHFCPFHLIYRSMVKRTAVELPFVALVEPPRDRRPGAVFGGDRPGGLRLDTPEALVGSRSLVAQLHFVLDELSAEQESGLARSLASWMGERSWAWCVCVYIYVCVCAVYIREYVCAV